MEPIKKPTKSAIEAALSAYYAEVDDAARKNALPDHQKVFDEIVMDSQDLQGVIIGTSTAVALSPFEDAPMEDLLKRAQDLIARGQLNEDLLQKVNAATNHRSIVGGNFHWPGVANRSRGIPSR